jgi:hypothetical protein
VTIGWKNLLQEAEERLMERGLRRPEARELLRPPRERGVDDVYWRKASEGVACFLGDRLERCYRLPLPFTAQVVVGRRFHLLPLLPLFGVNGSFFVLALSENRVRLLQGSRFHCQEIELHGVPTSAAEALRYDDRDEPLIFHSHPATGLGRKGTLFHGHGVGIDDVKTDLLRYFQQVDRGLHPWLRNEQAPLVLAAVKSLWPLYRKANSYPHLLETGISGNADHWTEEELHARAWRLVQPVFQATVQSARGLYSRLAGTGRTVNRLEEIVSAAQQGRIETLFAAPGEEQWGTVDAATGAVIVHPQKEPSDEELLNLAAVETLQHGGTVHLLPPEEMPEGSCLAAIYWLPHARRRS